MNCSIISGIYAIVNNVNGKMYIGQSINLEARESEHFRTLKKNCHHNSYLQKSFNKYGESAFEFTIMELCTESLLNEKESEYIQNFETMNKSKGYNLRSGGGVNYLSESSKKKISSTRKKRIAEGSIKIRPIKFTKEMRLRMSEGLKRHFSNKEARISLSKSKTTIPLELVKEIKTTLRFTELSTKEISERYNVSRVIVEHINYLNSHDYVCEQYNPFLLNRQSNIEKKKARNAIRLYREGKTYQEISFELGIHLRTAIRVVERNKNEHDERCRKNVLLWKANKQLSLIKTLFNMGNNKLEVSKKLRVSRSLVTRYLNGNLILDTLKNNYEPFNYKKSRHS